MSLAPDEFEKRKALLKNTPDVSKDESSMPPPGPDAFTTPKQIASSNSATPRKTPRTPGKSNADAPRFFALPEKGSKSKDESKGRKQKVKDIDPQFEEEEVGW